MIKKISLEEFAKISRKSPYTAVCKDIDQFISEPDTVCEIDVTNYKTAHSAAGAYRASAKRMGYNLDIMVRNGRCFMVKPEVSNDAC